MVRKKTKRAVPTMKVDGKGTVRRRSAKAGTSKKHPNNKDRHAPLTEEDAAAEARAVVAASRNGAALDLQPVISEESLVEGLSPQYNAAAIASNLDRKQVLAAMVLAMGYNDVQAAANAGCAVRTLKLWKKGLPFQSFMNELTLAYTEDVRAEAMRKLASQLRQDDGRADSDKDHFDWVKLALDATRTGGPRGGGTKAAGPASASVLHNHLHVHGADKSDAKDTDHANLLSLQKISTDLSGKKKRQLATILTKDDEPSDT